MVGKNERNVYSSSRIMITVFIYLSLNFVFKIEIQTYFFSLEYSTLSSSNDYTEFCSMSNWTNVNGKKTI